jgi:hypothetical protein
MRDNFADANYWVDLARERNIRLPLWRMSCTTGGMRRYLKRLHIEVTDYLEANNEKNLRQFSQMNPDWPLRAWVGLVLENLKYQEQENGNNRRSTNSA